MRDGVWHVWDYQGFKQETGREQSSGHTTTQSLVLNDTSDLTV